MSIIATGVLDKMRANLDGTVAYRLPVGEAEIDLNPLMGHTITLKHTGNIYCCSCGKKTKKSYSQGHCFVCMKKLASCDMCIMKPETCHFDQAPAVNQIGQKRTVWWIITCICLTHRA